ncbi:hypothetical protein BV898_06525 [Hypsibius exemplaris]|uniref:Odorant receptor n=1 Tax=Hypsibius exemplaris TaxID=2072580 RepID=A0A1W0WWG8_HYPEX|nr:hypothetical protein BV898_06525 [Hypsibius exemplaris]
MAIPVPNDDPEKPWPNAVDFHKLGKFCPRSRTRQKYYFEPVDDRQKLSLLPATLLTLFGILPSSSTLLPFVRWITFSNGIFHLVLGVVGFFAISAHSANSIYASMATVKGSVLVQSFSWASYFVLDFRANAVMLCFFVKRTACLRLFQQAQRLAPSFFPDRSTLRNKYNRWRRLALALGILCLCLPLFWEFLSNIGSIIQVAAPIDNRSKNNATFNQTTPSKTYLIPQPAYWGFFYFEVAAFCLAQLVIVFGVVLAVMLRSYLATMNASLSRLVNVHRNFLSIKASVTMTMSAQELQVELNEVRTHQASIRLFCAELNSCFGYTFFTSHILDQVSFMGFVAVVVVNLRGCEVPTLGWIFKFLSIAFFAGYSNLLLMPLANVYDESSTTNLRAYQLSVMIFNCYPAESLDSKLHGTIYDILCSSEPEDVVLRGARLITFKRSWFSAAMTFAVSFSVFAYEISQRADLQAKGL